jgi:two-component sensor histidine kinase/PAS domain-containing protein
LYPSGLAKIPHLEGGSHLAHFFASGDDLRDVVVPYLKAGLENNERCLWVTGQAFNAEQARSALRAAVPDLDRRERREQIEIVNGDQWYAAGDKPKPNELAGQLLQRAEGALSAGYAGLRTNGNCAWVADHQWADFLDYERLVQKAVRGRPMVCVCSYCVDRLRDGSQFEVMDCHDLALPSPSRLPRVVRPTMRQYLKEFPEATFGLAMKASQMGTWRYTIADNICIYDDNAQQLYGLTEARFLHDAEGVKTKFHPDDMDLMWSRVGKALDPRGDGRYDVEYRVKQLDGSWRWLSAWGIVEFDGEGPERKPVAISGASRDLTDQKRAEELQRLLLNELNHRVKNTFATIQAITAQTLRLARDLPSARKALDDRIRSLAQAHDLLMMRSWAGANLMDIVTRALNAFAASQIEVSGTGIEIPPKHALASSLILHELATNATKYGALSRPEGRVSLEWRMQGGMLHLDWQEREGPPVAPPTHRGFGSRLLGELVANDLGGETKLIFDPVGVRCAIAMQM